MTRLPATVGTVLALLATTHAAAAELPAGICQSEGTADTMRLMRYHLKDVAFGIVDGDGDGETRRNELYAVLTDPLYCGMMADEECEGAQVGLQLRRAALETMLKEHRTKIEPVEGPRGSAVPEVNAEVILGLLGTGRSARYVLRCEPATTTTPAPETPNTGSGGGGSSDAQVHFRLGRTLDDLTRSRASAGDWAKVQSAEISFTDDNEAGVETLSIAATAGVEIRLRGGFLMVPFVRFERSDIDNDAGTGGTDTAKLTLGASVTIPQGSGSIALSPFYAFDLESDSELIGGQVLWRPSFLNRVPSYGADYWIGRTAVEKGDNLPLLTLRTDAYLLGSFGEVLDAGSNPLLTDGREFVRLGGFGQVVLTGMRGPLKNFALDISYRHLFRISGDDRDVDEFRSSLAYWLDGGHNVSVQASYSVGRDQETLKAFDKWSLGLGLRF